MKRHCLRELSPTEIYLSTEIGVLKRSGPTGDFGSDENLLPTKLGRTKENVPAEYGFKIVGLRAKELDIANVRLASKSRSVILYSERNKITMSDTVPVMPPIAVRRDADPVTTIHAAGIFAFASDHHRVAIC
jgi:hypothetical protein